ncbi:hypothetical protein AB7W23_21580 [Providencia rettgeri]|uniref:hypothetical protein n=1 Tax=Providencia TaxID=586 RepID=UPI002349D1B5|nr:hypothetical protein [Providencia sp. PROV089]
MNFTNILSLALFLTLCLLASRLVAWLIWNVAYKRLYKRVSFKKQKVDENLQSLCRAFEKFKGKRVDSIKVVFEDDSTHSTFFGDACDQVIQTIEAFETLSEDEKQKLSNVAQEIISNRQKQGISSH